jgi:hypothetical protein
MKESWILWGLVAFMIYKYASQPAPSPTPDPIWSWGPISLNV